MSAPFKHTAASDARIQDAYKNREHLGRVAEELKVCQSTVIRRARALGLRYQLRASERVTQCACGDHVFASSSKGFTIMVSPQDAFVLREFSWKCHVNKKYGYVTVLSGNGGEHVLARKIMGAPKGLVVDHKNGITVDNRRSNLRVCTHAENMRNQKVHRKAAATQNHIDFARAA